MSVKTLQNAHEAYKSQRERIKAQQRVDLEILLDSDKKNLGKEISALLESGMNMVEITSFLGMKNRNYTYDMLRAYTGNEKRVKRKTEIIEPEPEEKTYSWHKLDDTLYEANVDGKNYAVWVVDGVPSPVDSWAEGTKEQRAIYKNVLNEIQSDIEGGDKNETDTLT